ncbi:DUF3153 domain-containing protein [Chroococcidiopsis sp. FACHB-1243]|uniref:DUF3153 domain-containing protein n=1 Tax=Chroococcidiopsis sp. [FACHB-1243] TaxID=2692781 RepID=UPI001781F97D|nr:DUF3153 domain-containing protein [Chroococcidiopsis sp. [FACHB-1243]]
MKLSILMASARKIIGQLRLLGIVLLSSLILSGCVQYQVGVNFDSPNYGEIVQHIQLDERLMSLSGDSVKTWLDSIERRAKQLHGKAKRRSDREVTVTIPFKNGADLAEKFNAFFHYIDKENPNNLTETDLPPIDSQLSLKQNNFLLLVRNRLSFDLDLRSLSLISTNTNLAINPSSILDFEFSLNAPWGGRSIEKAENAIPANKQGNRLIWRLQPGQINHIETIFWLPSPLGIGTIFIILFIALGVYLRDRTAPTSGGSREQGAV